MGIVEVDYHRVPKSTDSTVQGTQHDTRPGSQRSASNPCMFGTGPPQALKDPNSQIPLCTRDKPHSAALVD
ncbi:hypothetical protein BaRGS_00007358 [Batillaria attramentaria]|uniref:Uncharacterized protein n=1 Tax=Batillaria attramentaria TaxID=370345 RepID=A0ABD0LPX3_9CAEN